MKKISIIVPVYNTEKYLKKCLDSLINQSNNNDYEIIAINDGSTDNSEIILKKYAQKYKSQFSYYNKINGGLSSARNYGIKKATGEYLLFVDSDDYLERNALDCLLSKLNNEDLLVFNFNIVRNNNIIKVSTYDNSVTDIEKKFLISMPSACNKLIKRQLLEKNNLSFTDNIYYEDLMLMPKLIKYTKKINFISDHLYNYVVRDNSITNNKKFSNKVLDIFKIVDSLYSELYELYPEEIEYLYIEHLLRNSGVRLLDYKKYAEIHNINKIMYLKFPKWNKNKYYKKTYNLKQKVMCFLLYKNKFKLINLLRK